MILVLFRLPRLMGNLLRRFCFDILYKRYRVQVMVDDSDGSHFLNLSPRNVLLPMLEFSTLRYLQTI